MNIKDYIYDVPNFPKEGIVFKDITPIIANGEAFKYVTKELAKFTKECGATHIVSPESRGFIFGCPVATELGIGFVPVRKPGKLPRPVICEEYELEYGKNILAMHNDSLKKGDKVVVIDDLLATGGTLLAAIKLAERLGAEIVGVACVIELLGLGGKEVVKNYNYKCLVEDTEEM